MRGLYHSHTTVHTIISALPALRFVGSNCRRLQANIVASAEIVYIHDTGTKLKVSTEGASLKVLILKFRGFNIFYWARCVIKVLFSFFKNKISVHIFLQSFHVNFRHVTNVLTLNSVKISSPPPKPLVSIVVE